MNQRRKKLIYPDIWSRIEYNDKVNICVLLAKYCGAVKADGQKWVMTKDTYSGKKLAKYTDGWLETYSLLKHMNDRFQYRLLKSQKSEIAKNLINILQSDENITNQSVSFIGNWILTGPDEKRKSFF